VVPLALGALTMADPLMLLSWGACCGRILTVSEFPIARAEVRGLASLSGIKISFLAYPEDAFLGTSDSPRWPTVRVTQAMR
jgi:hypothetical protein